MLVLSAACNLQACECGGFRLQVQILIGIQDSLGHILPELGSGRGVAV